jgi:hypothetical protein
MLEMSKISGNIGSNLVLPSEIEMKKSYLDV